jgi:hypothetical protein
MRQRDLSGHSHFGGHTIHCDAAQRDDLFWGLRLFGREFRNRLGFRVPVAPSRSGIGQDDPVPRGRGDSALVRRIFECRPDELTMVGVVF